MMLFRILFFLLLVGGISFGINWLFENDGSVDFIWLGYHAHTTTAFLIIMLLFVFFAFVLLMQVIISLFVLPKKIKRKIHSRQLENNLITLQKGYAALLSGDVVEARRISDKLVKAPTRNENVNNLSNMLAAKTAESQGDISKAEEHYLKLSDSKRYKFFAVKGLLNSSFHQGNIEEAIDHAEEAYRLKPQVKDGAHSLLELYKKAGQHNSAEEFLKKYRAKHRIFKDKSNNINVKQELADLSYIRAKEAMSTSEGRTENYETAIVHLEKSLKADPYNSEKLILMMKLCKNLNNEHKAREYAERAWVHVQSFKLGAAYLNVFFNLDYKKSAKKKIAAIERLKKIANNPEIIEKLKDKVYDIQIDY